MPAPPQEVAEVDVVFDPARLDALEATGITVGGSEDTFDRLTRLVQLCLRVPVALVSLVEADRQVFKSHQGLAEPWCSLGETPISHSFCQHVVRRDAPFVVEDARADPLVRDNPAIQDLGVIAYLGAPLRTPGGHVLGSLCAIDGRPRTWTDADREALAALADVAMDEIAMRYRAQTLGQAGAERLGAMTAADLTGPETDAAFDRLARVACRELAVESALVTVLGVSRQVAEGRSGTDDAGVSAVADLNRRVVDRAAPLVVGNAATSPHVLDLAPVRGGGVTAYLGVPVRLPGGAAVGSFCVWDGRARAWTDDDVATLEDLAEAVAAEVAARVALRERGEARFRTLFDGLSQLTGLLDPDGTVVEANRAALAFVGLGRDAVVGRPLWESLPLPPEMEERHRDAVARAGAGESVRYEETLTDAGGREHVYDVSVRPVADGSGRLLLEGRDVTEAVRLRRVQSAMMIGMAGTWEIDLRTGGVTTHGGTTALFGLAPDGGPYTVDDYYARLHPADAEDARRHFNALCRAGGEYEVERRVVQPGGAVRYVRSRGVVLPGPDGRPERILGALTDTTEQRREAEAVARTAAELQMALGAAEMGAFEFDPTTGAHVGDDRARAVLGLTDNVDLGAFIDRVHPDDRPAFEAFTAGVLEGGDKPGRIEYRVVDEDGTVRWVAGATWAQVEDGRVARVIGTVRDVTDRKEAEAELRRLNDELEDRVAARTAELARSNAELDQFAYVASHDLKAPIRAVDSLATWIAEDAGDVLPADSARHLALLRQRAARMERLLDSLLAYSRAGRTGADPEPVDTAALVREVVETVVPPEGFDVRVEGDFPTVETARAPLALVLRNLVGNAVKHHDRPDGRVTVSARALPTPPPDAPGGAGWVEFTVEDDGPGIAPAYRDRAFGMFQTLRPRDEVEGSGMGLAVVKKTVESHGGRVAVEDGERGGARFRFTWPLTPPPAP